MTELAPLGDKRMAHTFRRTSDPGGPTRLECWEATTADGLWRFDREESPGTPWVTFRLDAAGHRLFPYLTVERSLRACRRAAANGTLQREWEYIQARYHKSHPSAPTGQEP